MRTPLITVMMLALFSASITFANPAPQKIHLKGGIVAEGHITRQQSKTITFSVETAVALIDSRWVDNRYSRKISKNKQERWRQWIDEHAADLRETKGSDSISLSTIELFDETVVRKSKALWRNDSASYKQLRALFGGGVSPLVYICEDGAVLRIVQVEQCECVFNIADISSIDYRERDTMALTGIQDVIETKNESVYKGQILSKVPGKMVRIRAEDGRVCNILNKDIACQKIIPLNKDLPIIKQTEFVDEVNGIRGIIVLQDNRGDAPYIIIDNGNGQQTRIEMKDIRSIDTYRNQQYENITDTKVQEDEVVFNRTRSTPTPCVNMRGLFVLTEKHKNGITSVQSEGEETSLLVEMKSTEDNRGAVLFPVVKCKVGKEQLYAFTFEDILNNAIVNKSEMITPGGTLRRTYTVKNGMYAIFVPKTKKVFYCNVR